MPRELVFHQALFGYDAGHHLLSASFQLPTDIRHFLAVATDLSGSAPAEGFEAAYTGLPLPGTNYYALFCTWLAPEMPRPGCVWSHVLFVDSTTFDALPDLSVLRSLFRRPGLDEVEEYRSPRGLRTENEDRSRLPDQMTTRAEDLLMALYMAPERSVILPAENAREFENLVFAIWSQQWARLRQSFRFSTGSFADRGRGGLPFDLQVTPETRGRIWERGGGYLLLDNPGKHETALPIAKPPSWIMTARDDLFYLDTGKFRSFLFAYGRDTKSPRSAFGKLGVAYGRLVLQVGKDWADLLRYVGESFPDESDAILLKEAIVNPAPPEQSSERNWATVSFLLASDQPKAYERVPIDFAKLAEVLWDTDKDRVLSLVAELVLRQERPWASTFVSAVAGAVRPQELALVTRERPDLIPLFLGQRPDLACHVETWRLPENSQWRVYEVLEGLSLDAMQWGEIMAAMFLTATNVAVRDAVTKAGPYAIQGALHWLDSSIAQEYLPSQLWREALAVPAENRLQSDESLSAAALALCSWLVPPNVARELLRSSRPDVQALAGQPLEMLPRPLRLHAAFLLVALALRARDGSAAALLARGFFPVYEALASGKYSSDSWLLIAPELPHLGAWREWDRCKKLRRAVREGLSQYATVVSRSLYESARDSEHRELVSRLFRG